MKKRLTVGVATLLLLSACSSETVTEEKAEKNSAEETTQKETTEGTSSFYKEVAKPSIDHIHGLGYPNGEGDVMIATHTGPVLYANGKWMESSAEKHDYMGFQAVKEGFYSSGHPSPNTDYENPLGIIKSTNKGESFETFNFEGEIDFHYLAAGYDTNRLYVFNEMPTEKLAGGFYYTDDNGNVFSEMAVKGLQANQLSSLAAHPTTPAVMAIGTDQGAYISENSGQSVELVQKGSVSSLFFTENSLYVAIVENGKPKLHQIDLRDTKVQEIALPDEIAQEPILYFAVSPVDSKEFTLVTTENSIYQTVDGGTGWKNLLE
ncbi:F510_1955 family glycosylhydrolase [Paenisporosarcina cavernae]|nr:sialidase [Paenisporosarcina cavernae]